MGRQVSSEEIYRAKRADLYSFLLDHHPDDVISEGDVLRVKNNRSVVIRKGWGGWHDFAITSVKENAINFLIEILGYEFTDAVIALQPYVLQRENSQISTSERLRVGNLQHSVKINYKPIPEPIRGPYKNVIAYLSQTRKIPANTIQQLINAKLLWQDERDNAVFANHDRTFAEVRGTYTKKPFHATYLPTGDKSAFWHWLPAKPFGGAILICESSIDAISLRHLLPQEYANHAIYVSIGGVRNIQRIDAIVAKAKDAGAKVVLAVDSDEAGQRCADAYPSLDRMKPKHKDWNEDLRDG